jgi:hypothetical protein
MRCSDGADSISYDRDPASHGITNGIEAVPSSVPKSVELAVDPAADLARYFLRLTNLPNYALDRLSRYEATLSRQVRRSCLRLMPWIAANHRIEAAVSVSAAGKDCRPTIPRNGDFRARRSRHLTGIRSKHLPSRKLGSFRQTASVRSFTGYSPCPGR